MKNFKTNLDQLKLYIDNVTKASEEIPTLQKMYDLGKINYDAVTSFPRGSVPFDLNNSDLNRGLQTFVESKGLVTPFTGSTLETAYPQMLTGATSSISEMRNIEPITQDEVKWKLENISIHEDLLHKWLLSDQIAMKLGTIGLSDLAKEFNEMCELAAKYKSGLIDHSSFGIKMRNVLEHIKGYLKKSAQITLGQKPSRDKDLSWEKMAKAIIHNPKSTNQINNFRNLGNQWGKLFDELSGLLKSTSIKDKEKLSSIFIEELLLIEAFLSSVDQTKLSKAI